MKFILEGNKILCRRSNPKPHTVVEFDAHLDTVPPHVTSQIASHERQSLERFLEDRNQIRSVSMEDSMIDVLPAMMDDARKTLDSVKGLDQALHERLSTSLQLLEEKLATVSVTSEETTSAPAIRTMTKRAVLKERLEVIKDHL